ncbi:MAG: hypothetical protein KGI38_10900 [Thaumarchaeota archaeon]|nr:hypothetical protein [Nitrososphaerota archaeon]
MYHAKWGKLMLVLFLAAVVVTASATVSVFFYTVGTGTVQTPDVQILAGPDVGASCTAYPCASGSVTGTHDVLTATLSFFPAATGASPIPGTYYSNFAQVKNTAVSGSHSIKSVQIINIGGTTADLGSITVYYCTAQTEFTAAGALVTPGNCVGSFAITSGTGGTVSGTFPVSIGFGVTHYIEVAAYAASGATASTSVTFQIAVQWS